MTLRARHRASLPSRSCPSRGRRGFIGQGNRVEQFYTKPIAGPVFAGPREINKARPPRDNCAICIWLHGTGIEPDNYRFPLNYRVISLLNVSWRVWATSETLGRRTDSLANVQERGHRTATRCVTFFPCTLINLPARSACSRGEEHLVHERSARKYGPDRRVRNSGVPNRSIDRSNCG